MPFALDPAYVSDLRRKVLDLAFGHLGHSNVRQAVRAINVVADGLHYPMGRFGRTVSLEERESVDPIDCRGTRWPPRRGAAPASRPGDRSSDPVHAGEMAPHQPRHQGGGRARPYSTFELSRGPGRAAPARRLEPSRPGPRRLRGRQSGSSRRVPDHRGAPPDRPAESIADSSPNGSRPTGAHLPTAPASPSRFSVSCLRRSRRRRAVCTLVTDDPAGPLCQAIPEAVAAVASSNRERASQLDIRLAGCGDVRVDRQLATALTWSLRDQRQRSTENRAFSCGSQHPPTQ